MKIRNNTSRRVSVGSLNISINALETVSINTLKAMGSDELQAYLTQGVLSIVSLSTAGGSPLDSFVSGEQSGQLSSADATALTGGANTTLHFHSTDRARSNHTGTQLKATISDFSHGSSSHTGAIGTLSQISDVTMTVANLNTLDDGVDTTLHFHNTDRARANHTGTQLKATISDFSHGSSSHTGAIGTLSQISDVTVTASNLNGFLPGAGATGSRPVSPATGYMYFDTTLGYAIWWNGTIWVKYDGTAA